MIDSVSRHITLIYLDFRGGPSILRNIPICALSSIICIHVQPSIARIRKLKKDLAMCTLVIYAVQKKSQSNEPYGLGADELLLSVSAGLRDKLW